MTTTERVAALRQRRKAAGLIRIEFYVTPDHATRIKKYVGKLTKEKAK